MGGRPAGSGRGRAGVKDWPENASTEVADFVYQLGAGTLAHEHADVAIPFASVDPARGQWGVREARRLIRDYGYNDESATVLTAYVEQGGDEARAAVELGGVIQIKRQGDGA